MPRPALNAPDEEWHAWIELNEECPPEENPEDDPVLAQELAECYGVLKQRAIQAANKALLFTDEEMQVVQALADQFYQGYWNDELRELCLGVNWNKPVIRGQCTSLRITQNDEQVLMQSACIAIPALKGDERPPCSEPFPVLKPDFSRQYSLFPGSESK
ncbi:hypothetical protein [Pseudogulbenkiania subflava]|uniref:hypothetical protein n=1 Tax=Pseudogulbenkiania subflava TaxID=451637 RepID=UPI00117B13CE|nr:hypothetical protein [Pseudogulbenkiania subflava]